MEPGDQTGVFFAEGCIGYGPAVCIDVERDFSFSQAIDRVVGQVGVHICLQIAGGADLEEDIVFTKVPEQGAVFAASYAMAYAGGMEITQCLPDTRGSCSLAGVCGAGDAVGGGVPKCFHVLVYGMACFVACDIEADDMGVLSAKFFDQFYCCHALLTGKMPEGAEDHAGLDAGFFYAFGYRTVDGGDDLFGGEAFIEVLQGGEAHFCVDHVVFFQLVEKVQSDEAQGFLGLHEVDGPVCPGDVVGQIGTYGRSDELLPVLFGGDRGVELVDYVVAERAVEVQVELDLWPGGGLGLGF